MDKELIKRGKRICFVLLEVQNAFPMLELGSLETTRANVKPENFFLGYFPEKENIFLPGKT